MNIFTMFSCLFIACATPSQVPTPTPTVAPSPTPTVIQSEWVGTASFYSREGCVGCSESLTMANGRQLDDSALTVAFNRSRLGSRVRITNLKTGDTVVAVVTDRGGFERLGRIIDMTVATRDAVNCSHLCKVKVTKL